MSNYYNNIDDFMLYDWNKCTKGEFKYTRLNHKIGNAKDDLKAWETIYDSYLLEFGLGTQSERLMTIETELINVRYEFIKTGERYLLNEIDILENEIKQLKSQWGDGSSLTTAIVISSKWLGSVINQKQISVKIFFTMLKEMQKVGKKST